MTVEQNVGAGLAGNKKKKQEQVQKMIRHFRLEGLEKDFRESFRRAAAESCAGEDHGIRTIRYSSR